MLRMVLCTRTRHVHTHAMHTHLRKKSDSACELVPSPDICRKQRKGTCSHTHTHTLTHTPDSQNTKLLPFISELMDSFVTG